MAQSSYLLSFRKRMKKRGYTDIHIKVIHNADGFNSYLVSAVEPLASTLITTELSLDSVIHMFRF